MSLVAVHSYVPVSTCKSRDGDGAAKFYISVRVRRECERDASTEMGASRRAGREEREAHTPCAEKRR